LKKGLSNPWLVIAVAMALLAVINVGYRGIVSDLSRTLDAQLGEQLGGLAETFASSLDVRAVRDAVGDADAFDADAYLQLRDQSRDLATVNRLVSATVLDTAWQDPFASDDDSLGRKVYSLLDREGGWALRSGLVWVSETFCWGDSYYRSAAAPVLDPATDELLAIARIEADARYFGALDRLERLAWGIHALSAALGVALIGLFLWYARATRRWEAGLLRSERLIGLGRLAATIAHEIKNPLGIIKATAQRLERVGELGASEEKRAELLRFIPEEVDRLNRILTRYLQIGMLEQSHPVPIDVARELSSWIATMGQKDHIELAVSDTPPVMADGEAPRQVVSNLIRNAMEASQDSEIVRVTWVRDGKWGVLRVANQGPGIPKKMRDEVFEPFYTTKATGTGLGLYAVKMLVERDGGTVAIEDNDGGGAVFMVRWPLAMW
jgi:signal transduction histidine kinase